MQIKVHLLQFTNDVRMVNVPEDTSLKQDSRVEHVLEEAFHWGQNDFQPLDKPSVSAGDVVEWKGEYWLIKACGFKKMTEDEFKDYKRLPRGEKLLRSLESVL